jgi:hypothetical protein
MQMVDHLEGAAAELGLHRVDLACIAAIKESSKLSCVAGVVVKVLHDESTDGAIVLHDRSGDVLCCVHGDVISTYPAIMDCGTGVVLSDVSVLITPFAAPCLVICLPNLVHMTIATVESLESRLETDRHRVDGSGLPEAQWPPAVDHSRPQSTVHNIDDLDVLELADGL